MFDNFRFIILAIGLLCLTSLACNYSIINFTFICMTQDENDVIDTGNGTIRQRFAYSQTEKSALHWAVAIGTITGTFPVNWAYVRWGARVPFFLAGVLSAVATAFSPLAAHFSLSTFIFLRFLQGVAYSADFAAVGVIVVRWSPLGQTAIFISFLTTFSSIASMVTNPVSGAFCTSTLGWRWAYYTFSAFTLIIFSIWLALYHDDPQKHRAVSSRELDRIQEGKTQAHIDRNRFVPYKAICTSPVIVVVWLNAFTELVGYIIMLTYGPTYLYKVLGYSIKETSYLSTIGAAMHFALKMSSGFLSDLLSFISENNKMMFFNTLAVGVSGILCALIGFMPSAYLALLMMTISSSLSGLNVGGFYKCATLHSRQYAHFVLAMVQFSKCVALVVGPLTVAVFASDEKDPSGWVIVFLFNGILMMIANVLFYFTATGDAAEFTEIAKDAKREKTESGIRLKEIS
ncbi:hypothetical protein PFISCL1PPCAC_15260 [Pristionchus fissidentatus]|uniref:Major facilitator superfamily (MFS) profile domain-containing protein n=1 Tax=Pristionchus fissidentatus TaxID=1538716 RepID=A0AAV5VZW5_9BILA|nr:hypothetical protein PFISCL1PPCAC_15260 [Pristionchus fissidentatus]